MIDLTNKRFGRLAVIRLAGKNKWGNMLWLCKCDCGNDHVVPSAKLIQGKSKSCGCYAIEVKSNKATRHGLTKGGVKPRTFTIWNNIKARCLNTRAINYKNYGGRGISICDEWMSFEEFHKWAVNNGYRDNLTIDRIDNNGYYYPDNCRWISRGENAGRNRNTILLTVNSETKSISAIAREVGISRQMISKLYHLKGKDATEDAIEECIRTGKGQVYFVNKLIKAS